jgi:hypothetical protein
LKIEEQAMVPEHHNASGAPQHEEFSNSRKVSVTAENVDTDSAKKGCLPRLNHRPPTEPISRRRRRSSSGNIKDAAYPSKRNSEELDTDMVRAGCFSGIRNKSSTNNKRGLAVFKGMLKRRRRTGTTVGTGFSGDDGYIIGLDVDCGDEHSCISDLDWMDNNASERTVPDNSVHIVALSGVWDRHDETETISETVTIDEIPCTSEGQALGRSDHDQGSAELSRTRPVLVSYILALALVFLPFLLLHIKQLQVFWN